MMVKKLSIVIPAYNEADSIARVIKDIPTFVSEIIVVNNDSTDDIPIKAKNAGATVLTETRKGYGYACLNGIYYITNQLIKSDIVVFLDGDYSDYPEELVKIVEPIINKQADLIIGARVRGLRE